MMTDGQRIWIGLFVALSLGLIYLLQPILTPFLVAALLAYLGDPPADKLEALGLSRTLSVCVVFLGLSLVAIVTLLLTLPVIGQQLDILVDRIPHWLHIAQQSLIPWLQQQLGLPEDSIPSTDIKALITQHWSAAGSALTSVWKHVAGSGGALLAMLANLVLIPVVTFYLLRDWDVLMARIRDFLPRSIEPQVVALARECDEILGAFIRGQMLVMLALGIVYAVGLWIVGLELALILGLLAGLASIVPYMGFIVGIAAAGAAAWFQFQEPSMLVWVAVVFGIGQALEGMVLTPLLVGDRIGLHPVAVIFAIMAGGQLAGFTGILLALPIAAVLMVFVRHAHRNYKQSGFYHSGSEPEPIPEDTPRADPE